MKNPFEADMYNLNTVSNHFEFFNNLVAVSHPSSLTALDEKRNSVYLHLNKPREEGEFVVNEEERNDAERKKKNQFPLRMFLNCHCSPQMLKRRRESSKIKDDYLC